MNSCFGEQISEIFISVKLHRYNNFLRANLLGNASEFLFLGQEELEEIMKKARDLSWSHFGKRIHFYAPSFIRYEASFFRSSPDIFPSISLTGEYCALKCKHCQGKILETMIPATTPSELVEACFSLKERGCRGVLISGGCLPNGSVPLDRFAEAIAQVKRELGLTIVVHTGIVSEPTAKKLKSAGVDAALIDIIGSDETIREIYGLNVKVEDYAKSLEALHSSGIPLVPHVLIGLHYGKLKGEFKSLELISKCDPAAVIAIAFMPIHGTQMENVEPPTPLDVARVLVAARFMMPSTPLVLGCARPVGEHRIKTDMLAVKAGVNAIAFPAEKAVFLAKSMGLDVSFSPVCCSQIYEDIKRR